MKRTIHACLPLHQMTGFVQPEQICFLPLSSNCSPWYLASTYNSHLMTLIPSVSLFKTPLYSYLARAHASYCGITCPQWHNRLVERPGEGDKATVCSGPFLSGALYVCAVALTPIHYWRTEINKNHENYWSWVFLESLFSNPGTPTCICLISYFEGNKNDCPTLSKSVHP